MKLHIGGMGMSKLQRFFASVGILVFITVFVVFFNQGKSPTPPASTSGYPTAADTGAPQVPVSTITIEKSSGRQFVSNELVVEFTPSLSEVDELSIIKSVGGEMIARTTVKPVFRVRITGDDGDGVATIKAVKLLENDNRVIHAEPNYITTIGQ